MKQILFRGALWALFALIIIDGYYTLVFLFHLLDELQQAAYGPSVYLKCVRVIGASMLYNAWPFAVLIFSLYIFRSRSIEQRLNFRVVMLVVVGIGTAFFLWFAFRNPVLYKENLALMFDIRMKAPPEKFGQYDNQFNLPAVMDYGELNEEIESSLRQYDSLENAIVSALQRSASYERIDSLLPRSGPITISMFDSTATPVYVESPTVLMIRLQADVLKLQSLERNISEARNKRNGMLIYPLTIMLMCAIGWSAGPLLRGANWLLIPLIVIAGLFPALALLQHIVQHNFGSWQSLISVPLVLLLMLTVFVSLSKRNRPAKEALKL
jgi:hypothetical protein